MVTNFTQTTNSLNGLVPKWIVFRFLNIEPNYTHSQNFSWLSLEGASYYIIQLSNSQGIVFRTKLSATDNPRETYCYQEKLLQTGEDYLFTVEVDFVNSELNDCQVNNEKIIAEYVSKGIYQIKQLDLFSKQKANLLVTLDSLLMIRDELLNLIWGVTRQGSNSETICFLNNFLAQTAAFELLAQASKANELADAFREIATQLAGASITLAEYLHLSYIQQSMAESLAKKAVYLALFSQNIANISQLKTLFFSRASSNCFPFCMSLPEWIRCGAMGNLCGGCEPCGESN